ncbi:MAG: hypothetical protein ACD_22C00072G0007 [uncultured bacterium]|nr:MAG: hypothetical protein ACD_22C00072G0007 [uncultured bacterium]
MNNVASIKRFLDFGMKWVLYLLLFITPLVFVTNTNELYEFPKTFFIYFLGVTLVFLFLLRQIIFPQVLVFPNKFIMLLLASFIVSTALSSHLYTSVWGYYTRFNGGLVSVGVLFGVYFVCLNLDLPKLSTSVVKTLALTLLPISLYAIYQYFTGVVRAYSTFGQPNWLAAYLGMLLPLTLYLAVTFSPSIKPEKIFWWVSFIAGFFAVVFTFSLSGLLGSVVGLVVFAFANREVFINNFKKVLPLGIVLVVVAGVVGYGVFGSRLNDVWVDVSKMLDSQSDDRENSTSPYALSDPGFIRTGLWKGTMSLIVSSPKVFIFGTGPETFPYVFQPFRPSELNYSSEWDFIFNKPHNYFLEIFSQNGVLGLIIYLAVIIWSLRRKTVLARKAFIPSLAVLYVTNIFGWPSACASLMFWVFLAILGRKNA